MSAAAAPRPGPSATWGDGGGGSGASGSYDDLEGRSAADISRKLVASELGSWVGRQEQVVRDLRRLQEQGLEQVREKVEATLACHQKTLERLLVWHLDPHHAREDPHHAREEDSLHVTDWESPSKCFASSSSIGSVKPTNSTGSAKPNDGSLPHGPGRPVQAFDNRQVSKEAFAEKKSVEEVMQNSTSDSSKLDYNTISSLDSKMSASKKKKGPGTSSEDLSQVRDFDSDKVFKDTRPPPLQDSGESDDVEEIKMAPTTTTSTTTPKKTSRNMSEMDHDLLTMAKTKSGKSIAGDRASGRQGDWKEKVQRHGSGSEKHKDSDLDDTKDNKFRDAMKDEKEQTINAPPAETTSSGRSLNGQVRKGIVQTFNNFTSRFVGESPKTSPRGAKTSFGAHAVTPTTPPSSPQAEAPPKSSSVCWVANSHAPEPSPPKSSSSWVRRSPPDEEENGALQDIPPDSGGTSSNRDSQSPQKPSLGQMSHDLLTMAKTKSMGATTRTSAAESELHHSADWLSKAPNEASDKQAAKEKAEQVEFEKILAIKASFGEASRKNSKARSKSKQSTDSKNRSRHEGEGDEGSMPTKSKSGAIRFQHLESEVSAYGDDDAMVAADTSADDEIYNTQISAPPEGSLVFNLPPGVPTRINIEETEDATDCGVVRVNKGTKVMTLKNVKTWETDASSDEDGHGDESEESESGSEGSQESRTEGERKRNQTRRFSDWEKDMRLRNLTANPGELDEDDSAAKEPWVNFIVRHRRFDTCAAVALISNAVLIGVQVNERARTLSDSSQSVFSIVDLIYCIIFVVELLFRVSAAGLLQFFQDEQWQWNVFDFIVVSLQVVETIVTFMTLDGESGIFSNILIIGRLARVARIVRVVRVIRVMRFFRAFRLLITMCLGTVRSGVWAAVLLFLTMYVFAIVFTQAVADYLIDHGAELDPGSPRIKAPDGLLLSEEDLGHELLMFYYGTVLRSVFTLFKAIFGGVDWENVVLPLSDVGFYHVILFLVYVIFVQLAVMNVVTGLFLQSAIEQAQQDQEHIIGLHMAEKKQFVERLHTLFAELDSSHDGYISLDEFEEHLKNEHMQALIQTFEIDNADAWTLFKLLDSDGGGSVDINEFVDGCIRLKGNAKSIQMAQVMYHHRWIMDKLVDVSEQLLPVCANQRYIVQRLDKIAANNGQLTQRDSRSGSRRPSRRLSSLPGASGETGSDAKESPRKSTRGNTLHTGHT